MPLVLKRANLPFVLVDGAVVGRIMKAAAVMGMSWMWTPAFGLYVREDENACDEDV